MPPRKRAESQTYDEVLTNAKPDRTPALQTQLLKLGAIVNIVSGGRTLPSYEVLDFDDKFVKFRGSIQIAPQTELVLVPWAQIEAIGLVGER